ncbi:hypothetical protein RRG08_025535 [Elysia crispata]|uniref:Uncharacterized protein n=1 Tax=Elysia crispata TaxID=231223 RepID=A0AAE1ACV7_9GAST|nr:hypothetical protein RRG08_025535 [Elysia crispata]
MPVGGRCDDRASHVSLCVIVAGIVLVIIGCLWPLEPAYVIDPSLTAAENEALQEDYTWRRNTLFLVSALGMACLVTGGFITSILVVRVMCHENREEDPAKLSPDWPFPPQHDMPPTESPLQQPENQLQMKQVFSGCRLSSGKDTQATVAPDTASAQQ